MVIYTLALVLATISLFPTWALQVTPNSDCASVCTDYYGADASDPNNSKINASDIVCSDSDYSTTVAGFKFRSCIDCLQSSNAVASGETDQAWFLYNIRYTVNQCLYAAANTTSQTQSPCAVGSLCNPLKAALETGLQRPFSNNEFSYCNTDDGGAGFASPYLATCQQCLQQNTNSYYLSNFLVALDAGCTQRPADGDMIGLSGSLFSQSQVTIIDTPKAQLSASAVAVSNSATSMADVKARHDVLTGVSISGIVIGGLGLLLIVGSCIFICMKKYRNAEKLQRLRSPFHSRFGAANISAPIDGASSSPETSPPMSGIYQPRQMSPPIRNRPVTVSRAPPVRNFSMRNFGLSMHHQERRTLGRIDTKHILQTPDSFSPGPSLCSPQTPYQDLFPTHYAYIQPTLPPISETSNPHNNLPQPLASNPTNPIHTIPIPSRARFSGFSIPHVSTIISGSGSHSSKTPIEITSAWAPKLTHKHPADAQISTPIMTMDSRFESEADVQVAREVLQKNGMSGTSMRRKRQGSIEVRSPEKTSPDSASTAVSIEMWPGSF